MADNKTREERKIETRTIKLFKKSRSLERDFPNLIHEGDDARCSLLPKTLTTEKLDIWERGTGVHVYGNTKMADGGEVVNTSIKSMRKPVRKSLKGKKRSKTLIELHETQSACAQFQQPAEEPSENNTATAKMSSVKKVTSVEGADKSSPVSCRQRSHSEQQAKNLPHPFFKDAQSNDQPVRGIVEMKKQEKAAQGLLKGVPKKLTFRESNQKYLLALINKQKNDSALKEGSTFLTGFDDDRPRNDMPRTPKNSGTNQVLNKTTKTSLLPTPFKIYCNRLPKNDIPKKKAQDSVEQVVETVCDKMAYCSDADTRPNNCMPPKKTLVENQNLKIDIPTKMTTESTTATELPRCKAVYCSDPESLPNNYIRPKQPSSRSLSVDRGICADAICKYDLPRKTVTIAAITTEQLKNKAVYRSNPDSLPNNYIPPKKLSSRSLSVDRGICADVIDKNNTSRKIVTEASVTNKAIYRSDPDSLPNNCIPPKKPSRRSQSVDRGICADVMCKDNQPQKTATIAAITTERFKHKAVYRSDPDSLPNNYILPKKSSMRSQSLDRGTLAHVLSNVSRKTIADTFLTTKLYKNKLVYSSDPDSLPNNYIPPKNKKPLSYNAAMRSKTMTTCPTCEEPYREPDSLPTNSIPKKCSTSDKTQKENTKVNIIEPLLKEHEVNKGKYYNDSLFAKSVEVSVHENDTTKSTQEVNKSRFSDRQRLPTNRMPHEHSLVSKIEKPEKRPHYEELPKNKMPKSTASKIIKPLSRATQVPKMNIIPDNAKLTNETEKTKRNTDAKLCSSNAQLRLEVARHGKHQPVNRKQELITNMNDDMLKIKKPVKRDLQNQTQRASKDVTVKARYNAEPSEHIRAPPVSHSHPTTVNREKKQLIKPVGQIRGAIKLEQEVRKLRMSISKEQALLRKAAKPSHLDERSNTMSKAQALVRKAAEPSQLEEQSNAVRKSQAIEIAAELSNLEKQSNAGDKEQAIEMKPAQPSHLKERSNAVSQEPIGLHSQSPEAIKLEQEVQKVQLSISKKQALMRKAAETSHLEEQSNAVGKSQAIEIAAEPLNLEKLSIAGDKEQAIEMKPAQPSHLKEQSNAVSQEKANEIKATVLLDLEQHSNTIRKERALERESAQPTVASVAPSSEDIPKQRRETPSKLKQETLKYESLKSFKKLTEHEQKLTSKVMKEPKNSGIAISSHEAMKLRQEVLRVHALSLDRKVARKPTMESYSRDAKKQPRDKSLTRIRKFAQTQQILKHESQPTLKKGPVIKERVQSKSIVHPDKDMVLKQMGRKHEMPKNVKQELAVDAQLHKTTSTTVNISSQESPQVKEKPPATNMSTEFDEKPSLKENQFDSHQRQVDQLQHQELIQPLDRSVQKESVTELKKTIRKSVSLKSMKELLEQQEATKPFDHDVPKPFVGQHKKSTKETASVSPVNELLQQQESTKAINNDMPKQFVGNHKKGTYTQTNKEKSNIDIAKQQILTKKLIQRRVSRDRLMYESPNKTVTRPFVRKTSKTRQKVVRPPTSRPHSMGDVLVDKKVRPTKNVLDAEDKEISRHEQVSHGKEARKQEQVQSIVNEYDRSMGRITRYPTVLHKLRKNNSEQALQMTVQQSAPQMVVPPTTTQIIPPTSNPAGVADFEDYLNYHPNLQRFIPDSVARKSLKERLARTAHVALPSPLSQPQQHLPTSRAVVKPRNTASGNVRPTVGSSEQIKIDRSRPYVYQQMKVAMGRTNHRQVVTESHNKSEKPVLYQQLKAETVKTAGHNNGLGRYQAPRQQQSIHDWSKSDKINKSKKPNSANPNSTVKEPAVDPKQGDAEAPAGKGKSSKIFTSTVITNSPDQSKSEQSSTPNHSQLPPEPLVTNVLKPSEATHDTNVANILTKESAATVKVDTRGKPGVLKTPFRLEDDDEFELKYDETNHPTIKPHPGEMWINEIDSGNITERTVNITAGQTHPRSMQLTPLRLDDKPRSDVLATRKSNVEFNSHPKLSELAREAQGAVKPAEKPSLVSDKAPTMTNKMSGVKGTPTEEANKTTATLDMSTVINKTSTTVDMTSGAKGTTTEGANKATLSAVNTPVDVVQTGATPDKTRSAADTMSTVANKTPTVANADTKITVDPSAVTKAMKPFRLEDDEEFDLNLEETDRHPRIKPAADALWLQKANLGEISENTVNRPEGQNHPRPVNVKLPPHPQMKPLRDCAWTKKADLAEVIEKTVSFAGTTTHPSIINVQHSLKDNRHRQHLKTSQVPQTQQKETAREPAAVTPELKQPGWKPEVLQEAVVEASKGLHYENKRNRVDEVEQTNIEDLILAKLNPKRESAPTKPDEAPKVHVAAPRDATSGGANKQQQNVPSKLPIVRPTSTDDDQYRSLDPGTIIQREEDRELPGTFSAQINKKTLRRLIEMEFERMDKEGKGPPRKPGEKVRSGIELYTPPADMPELPDVDSLIRSKPDSERLNSQTHTPQLNIKMLREEIDELKQIGRTKKPPAVWRPQNNTTMEVKGVDIPQQLIDKIPVQGKEESGMVDNCEKPNNPTNSTTMEDTPIRIWPQDERTSEPTKITTLKQRVAGRNTNSTVQVLHDTLEEVGSTMMKQAKIATSHGQAAGKSLQNEIKTYVKDLYKSGAYFQNMATKKLEKQCTQSQSATRLATKQQQQQQRPSTVNDDSRKKPVAQVQSPYKQPEAARPRYNQIQYPFRLRTQSGSQASERAKTAMQSDARPSTSSGETAPVGAARSPEEVPTPAAGSGKPPPPPSNANRSPPLPLPPKEGYFPPCDTQGKTTEGSAGGKGGAEGTTKEGKAETEWARSSGEPPLTGLSKHFNSSTIRGRANVAKATFALIGLYTVYRMLRKEPREY